MKPVPPQPGPEVSLEKPLDRAGKARGVMCDAQSEPEQPGMAARAGAAQLARGTERGSKSNWCFKWQRRAASSQDQGWFSSPDESSLVGRLISVCLSLSPHLNHFLVRLQCCANLSFPIILVHFASAPCVTADL